MHFSWLPRVRGVENSSVEPVVVMAYVNFAAKHKLLARQQYAVFDEFAKFSRELVVSAFHVKANRDKVRAAYADLIIRAPFSREERFPDDFYVHLGNRNLERIVAAILHACDLPDRLVEKGRSVDNNLSDAKRNFDVNVEALLAVVNCVDIVVLKDHGIYDRENVEATFGLNWV